MEYELQVAITIISYVMFLGVFWKIYLRDEIKSCKSIKDFFIESDEEE